jgi:DNA-binding NtrC family response regulator
MAREHPGKEELARDNPSRKDGTLATKAKIEGGSIPLKRIVREARQAMSRELILRALKANRWNRKKAANELKISYRTLLYEIRQMGLPPKRTHRPTA